MDPVLEKVTVSSKQSFAIKEEILPYIEIGWHFHPEYELTLFTESTGKRFIGDHTDHFGPGDLLLIGPKLPHYMRNDQIYYAGHEELRIRAIVVHFAEDFLGEGFFDLPEMLPVRRLLEKSARGIRVSGPSQAMVAPRMEAMLQARGYDRLRILLDILHFLSRSEDLQVLSSMGYTLSFRRSDAGRINRVFEHLLTHYTSEVGLSDLAELVNMSESAFCKFFKLHTGKTFSYILNELRIGHACRLFIEEDLSVTEACYRSGYNSLSYFNRRFKAVTGLTPSRYRKRFFQHA